MQSKHSAVLVGQLTLLAIACLFTAFALILMEGGQVLAISPVVFLTTLGEITMSLLLHCGAFSTTYDDLLQVKLPETTSTYEPIPHHEIVDSAS